VVIIDDECIDVTSRPPMTLASSGVEVWAVVGSNDDSLMLADLRTRFGGGVAGGGIAFLPDVPSSDAAVALRFEVFLAMSTSSSLLPSCPLRDGRFALVALRVIRAAIDSVLRCCRRLLRLNKACKSLYDISLPKHSSTNDRK
jgi:hypothetical protein